MSRISRFNEWLAVHMTAAVATMYCAYCFAALAFIALPDALRSGTFAVVQWISQTFIQLVMLSVIMVGQRVMDGRSAGRDDGTLQVVLRLEARILHLEESIAAKEGLTPEEIAEAEGME